VPPLEAPTLQYLQSLVPLRKSDLPKPLPQDAGQQELWEALSDTRSTALEMADQIETLTAWCKLYASENAVLRNHLHGKKTKPKDHFLASKARVLTKPEQMEEIRKKEEDVRRKAAAKEANSRGAKQKGYSGGKGKGKAAKVANRAVWIDEDDDSEGGSDVGIGRAGDNEEYEPSVNRQASGSKRRSQRARRSPLVELQLNIEPIYGGTEATHQELATDSNTAAVPRRSTRSRPTMHKDHDSHIEIQDMHSGQPEMPPDTAESAPEENSTTQTGSPSAIASASTHRTRRNFRVPPALAPDAPEVTPDEFFIRNAAAGSSTRLGRSLRLRK
jgi:hypothetical protein